MAENPDRAKPVLLVVEDDPGLQKQLKWSFDDLEVVIAGDRQEALAALRRHEPAVVTLDLGLPPDADGVSEGLATLHEMLALAPATKVIVVSGNQDRANAVKAVGMGAYDFYQKPFDLEVLQLIIKRAFHVAQLEAENRKLQRLSSSFALTGILTAAEPMLKVCRTIEKVAPVDATVLLLGESGTGKELLARALHELSPRAGKRFVAINCAAIPETLLESELFGYEKGAFTGASKQTKGKIEYADGGTFFLDEVGDLPMALQAKLLRFLQERVVERLGGREEIPVDVRVVCATHRDLSGLIAEGRFREDLYYRISEITVAIPPLRERAGDAALLAQAFLERFAEQFKKPVKGFTPEAVAALEAHTWPGNVRELENCIKRAVIMSEDGRIGAADLGLAAFAAEPLNLRQVREEAERRAVTRALARAAGNVARAAELLGVSRPTLYDLINRYGLVAKTENNPAP
ncbi:PEP-CTERM-box response regulator transcription factor [Thiobacter aerophilum]|uniref:PEP-CTERM-box response regulator transcription factor n=1 Tax=Thiobacter aerophilum TaxID=3121275 RepID=A0ABV0EGH4_9BURK